jgi:two-component system, OmpR family, response regulator QseB
VTREDGVSATRVLLVEDERELAGMLNDLLVAEGYDLDHAPDGQAGLHLALSRTYDVIVLDRGLPAIEGLDLLRRLRARGIRTPVLVLTAYDAVADRVEGLDSGAQDHLGKPFDVDELLARLRALVRRDDPGVGSEWVDLGERHLDLGSRLVVSGGERRSDSGSAPGDVTLSERESQLLATLARRPSKVFSRAELLDQVFTDAEDGNAVETYISYLRRKLGPDVVRTVRGVGYRMGRT